MAFHLPERFTNPTANRLFGTAMTPANLGTRFALDISRYYHLAELGRELFQRRVDVYFEPMLLVRLQRVEIRQNALQQEAVPLIIHNWDVQRRQFMFCQRAGATSRPI